MGTRVMTFDGLIARLELHRKGINDDMFKYFSQNANKTRGLTLSKHNMDIMGQMGNMISILDDQIKDLKETQGFQHYTNSNHDNNIQSKNKHPGAPSLRP